MAIDFFKGLFPKADFLESVPDEDLQQQIEETRKQVACRDLAYQICVQRIARAIAKCEFLTYRKHEEQKGELYYRLNVSPNGNQNATDFWTGFINHLYTDQEALIVQSKDGQLFVADSWSVDDERVMTDWIFKDVTVGNFTFSKPFAMKDVLFFRLQNNNIKNLLDDTTDLYGKLISLSYKGYKKAQGRKFKLRINRQAQTAAREKEFKEKLKRSVSSFMKSDDAVFIENEGHELSEINASGSRASSASGATTRDITALMDDVLQMTCKAFLMPTNIVTGEVTDTSKAVDDFLTFCLDFVVELIEDEINRKIYTMRKYLDGNYVRINSSVIKHVDVFDLATSIDKLLSSGVMTINDIKRYMRAEPIQEDFADQHFMTKNYSPITELANALEDKGRKESETNENGNTDVSDESESSDGNGSNS